MFLCLLLTKIKFVLFITDSPPLFGGVSQRNLNDEIHYTVK
jgi:hypothetical protein